MKTFKQFSEVSMPGSNPVISHIREIEAIVERQQEKISRLSQINEELRKTLFTIKINLERSLKDKSKLNSAVYDSINLAKKLTPYSSDYGITNKIEPDLSDEEKTL